jgi:Fatty acid desaturase
LTIHPEELKWARAHEAQTEFQELSPEQMHQIMTRGRELHHWFKTHYRTHCLINAALLVFLLVVDFLVVLRLPGIWLTPGSPNSIGPVLLASVITAAVRSWVMYSLTVFTMHEGAAHKAIFPPRGPLSRAGNFLASNLCRIAGSVPDHYAVRHMIHHSKFGTEEDAEFLNFVTPRRYAATFVPFALVFNFSDFIIHRPPGITKSSLVTTAVSFAYQGVYGYLAYRSWGLMFPVVHILLVAHMGFYLDRVRQFTEHNLMPLDNPNGSRSFGLGFWGMLVGGGPWGSPCHWEHHLVASIPWYQQLMLHRFVVRLLTPQQRKQFLLEPIIGFPRLWWRLIRDCNSFARGSA